MPSPRATAESPRRRAGETPQEDEERQVVPGARIVAESGEEDETGRRPQEHREQGEKSEIARGRRPQLAFRRNSPEADRTIAGEDRETKSEEPGPLHRRNRCGGRSHEPTPETVEIDRRGRLYDDVPVPRPGEGAGVGEKRERRHGADPGDKGRLPEASPPEVDRGGGGGEGAEERPSRDQGVNREESEEQRGEPAVPARPHEAHGQRAEGEQQEESAQAVAANRIAEEKKRGAETQKRQRDERRPPPDSPGIPPESAQDGEAHEQAEGAKA